MRTIGLTLLIGLFSLSAMAQNFEQYGDNQYVTTVSIDKNMFKMMSNLELESESKEAQEYLKLVESLEGVNFYKTEKPSVKKEMAKDVDDYVNSGKLQNLMKIKDKGKNIGFYFIPGKTDEIIKQLFMYVDSGLENTDESVVVIINGNIDLKQISQLINKLNLPGGDSLKEKTK
ncbi:MAG: DUF4252 domain-containing protein [Psychroflexus sp.]|jgi:hypothetical protein|nr:DUF4252 domain-containing protein [Psychroflexus sp.]MDR9448471.1 DUF4252 domain-containing protein [Psychroflexus sp.]